MKPSNSIQRCLAALLGLVLLIGILPKSVVHEWLTGHAHQTAVAAGSESHFDEAGTVLNCSCFQTEFSPLLLAELSVPEQPIHLFRSVSSIDISTKVPVQDVLHFSLRGPPANA